MSSVRFLPDCSFRERLAVRSYWYRRRTRRDWLMSATPRLNQPCNLCLMIDISLCAEQASCSSSQHGKLHSRLTAAVRSIGATADADSLRRRQDSRRISLPRLPVNAYTFQNSQLPHFPLISVEYPVN